MKIIILIILIALAISIRTWDNFGSKEISKVWKQPDLNEAQLTLSITGSQSPIQFFDLDNLFELQITDGGYIYARTIDLIEGQNDYEAYLGTCSVRWETNSILFIEPSGRETKMPLEMITNRI